MYGKSFFIDQTRCTACRGCQVACKQWKKLPADATENNGSYQNPPDLNDHTFKLVRFQEAEIDGKLKWLFFPEQCRHCLEPPCKMMGDAYIKDAIVQDAATGAVIYTEKTKDLDYKVIREACPYDIPRKDTPGKPIAKCNMCIDRVRNNMLPACVKTCPTDTMHFGDRNSMMDLAVKRLSEVRKTSPAALLADSDQVRVIYLCEVNPSYYYQHMVADRGSFLAAKTPVINRRELLGFKVLDA